MKEDNYNRNAIMILLEIHGSLTISQIAKELKISRPVVYLHLENLEKRGFIKRSKDTKKKGAPVTITTTGKQIEQYKLPVIRKILKIIKEHDGISEFELLEKSLDQGNKYPLLLTDIYYKRLIDKKIHLTDKGKKFLREK